MPVFKDAELAISRECLQCSRVTKQTAVTGLSNMKELKNRSLFRQIMWSQGQGVCFCSELWDLMMNLKVCVAFA